VRKSLTNLQGVIEAVVDLKGGTATVTYDPSLVELDELTEATANAGFPSTVHGPHGT